jgi:hypothetical protein
LVQALFPVELAAHVDVVAVDDEIAVAAAVPHAPNDVDDVCYYYHAHAASMT